MPKSPDKIKDVIKDAARTHWVYRAPTALRPYLQLSRLDRPIGYWLLALPGWIGLAFAGLSHGFSVNDLKWAGLILMGAIAMRGAGCTYNDIIDQDMDAKVERTAARPLPAGTVSTRRAWGWVLAQCAVGLVVLLCLPRLAQITALCALPLVAAYPFMKRVTWWPQLWLGLTFNWAVLVAFATKVEAAKVGAFTPALFILYGALIFWTVGYDTIYACQDIEDDAMIGVKSTARRFGKRVKLGVGISYALTTILAYLAITQAVSSLPRMSEGCFFAQGQTRLYGPALYGFSALLLAPMAVHLGLQAKRVTVSEPDKALKLFKSNIWAAGLLIAALFALHALSI